MESCRICRVAALLVTLLLAVLAGAVEAGPWPREAGTHFLSLSAERDRDGNSYAGLYGEYGFSAATTIGYEFGGTNVGETTGILWLQRPLGGADRDDRLTLALGAGFISRNGEVGPVGLAAAAWGRGFEGFLGGGWITAEGRVLLAARLAADNGLSASALALLTPEATAKADLTIGLRPRSGMMLINQLRLEQRHEADFTARFAGSVVQDLAGPVKLELGAILPLTGPGEHALKIGTWLEF